MPLNHRPLRRATLCLAALPALLVCPPARAEEDPARTAPRPDDVAERLRSGRLPSDRAPRRVAPVTPADDRRVADAAARIAAGIAAGRGTPPKAERAAPRAGLRPRTAPLRRRLDGPTGESVEVVRAAGEGSPRQVRGRRLGAPSAVPGTRAERDVAAARDLLRSVRGLLRLEDPDAEMRSLRADTDDLGCRQVRFTQTWRGLDVWPSGLVVQVRDDGSADAVTGVWVPTPRRVATRPTVAADVAGRRAQDAVPGGAGASVSVPELILFAGGTRPRLAWRTEVAVSDASRWLVVVDAHTGAVLARFDQVAHEDVAGSGTDLLGATRPLRVYRSGATFHMVDTSKQMFDPTSSPPDPFRTRGGIVILDASGGGPQPPFTTFAVTSSSATSWSLRDAVSASFGLSQTYDYFLVRHGRDSLDGEGGTMTAVVRIGTNYPNAFWNGQYMAFGDAEPYAASLDVVGHELTHGVTEKTAGLVYMDQSGALNEAMSDIFGEMVEARTNGGAPDWRVGTALSAPLRDMRDPGSILIQPGLPYPERMSQFIETSEDNGGVHLNSSIINRAYYLLAEGLTNAVGLADAERIFYRTLTTKLVQRSRFQDCRLGAIASAEELFGAGSAQAQATRAAFDAVEILDAPPTEEPAPAPAIDGPDATVFLNYDPNLAAIVVGRRETDLGDGPQGVLLATGAGESRPSVSGDGSVAVVVSSDADVCLLDTAGAQSPDCAGLPGTVHSVAIARDGSRFAFVLLDAFGDPDNSITVVETATAERRTFPLAAPLLDGGTAEVILADAMTFSRDGSFLVYDAFNVLSLSDGSQAGAWSIYGLDLESETVVTLVEPTPGLDIGSPALGHTTDRWLTFEAIDAANGASAVLTRDLFTGDLGLVAAVPGATLPTAPCFTGDDGAVVFTAPAATNTGASLLRQDLAEDRLTPQGPTTTWLSDAAYGVVYRRGDLPEPPPPAEFELALTTGAPRVESLAADVPVGAGTVPVRLALAHTVSGSFTAGGTCTVGGEPVTVGGKLTYRAATRTFGYTLTLRSASSGIRGTIRGDVGAATARVVLSTPEGKASVTTAATVTGYTPTSRITLRPEVDFRGRIGGTANVLSGFGNDGATTARLTGTVRPGSLRFSVIDAPAKRRLDFKGVRGGAQFVGKLKYRLPPASGSATGYAVPDLF